MGLQATKTHAIELSDEVVPCPGAPIGGKLGRVLSWYDNEWGFSNRMLDTAVVVGKLG